MLGQMIQVAGADHILWGTDSIWGGSPQSQIDRLRRLKMTDELIEKYKYPRADRRDQGPDPRPERGQAVRHRRRRRSGKAIKADKLTQLREEYRQEPGAEQHAVRLGVGGGRDRADCAGRGGGVENRLAASFCERSGGPALAEARG